MNELREALWWATAVIGHGMKMSDSFLIAGKKVTVEEVYKAGVELCDSTNAGLADSGIAVLEADFDAADRAIKLPATYSQRLELAKAFARHRVSVESAPNVALQARQEVQEAIKCLENVTAASDYENSLGQAENALDRALAALSAAQQGQGEPVAWMHDLLRLIAQRAQYATSDDAQEALTWIYHAASRAAGDGQNIHRLAFDTLYVNLLKTNPDHAFTEFARRVSEGKPWAQLFDGLDNFDVSPLSTAPQPDRESVLREALNEVRSIALSYSNMGHVEGNKRAFDIISDIDRRLALLTHPTTDTQSDAVGEP
jgi:tetratricopeptide (TPR) repeat protein